MSAFAWLLAFAAIGPLRDEPDDAGPLTIDDLGAYRHALRTPDADAPAPEATSFGDLWNDPEGYRGRRVTVEGRAARRFRQGAIGEYPPLVELWLASGQGDPTCVVYPEPIGGDPTPLGALVRFDGTFLRRLRYQGADEPRLAPLVVGPLPPEVVRPPRGGSWRPIGPFQRFDGWLIWSILLALIASTVARYVLLRPRSRRRSRAERAAIEGPTPEFVDGPYDGEGHDPIPSEGPPSPIRGANDAREP